MRTMLKSKIHRARVTDANINYEGSITIDRKLMAAADIIPYEQVHVLNVNNGGDIVIILTYTQVPEEELKNYRPKVVHVNANNAIVTKLDEKIFV
jgi:aspartate 1-decarboxylase